MSDREEFEKWKATAKSHKPSEAFKAGRASSQKEVAELKAMVNELHTYLDRAGAIIATTEHSGCCKAVIRVLAANPKQPLAAHDAEIKKAERENLANALCFLGVISNDGTVYRAIRSLQDE